MFTRRLIIIFAALMVAFSASVFAGKKAGEKGGNRALSEQEVADLVFMREEEKLAHDVYVELYGYYKDGGTELIIFANIAASEQRHMDAMLGLLEKYRIDDPASPLPGVFANKTLQELYGNLMSDSEDNVPVLNEPTSGGKAGVEEALYVGAWIEERDMIDIMHAISDTSRADIVGVYTNLLCGSRSHLRAFVKKLGPDDYEPQILYSSDDVGSDVQPEETLEYWLGDESDELCM